MSESSADDVVLLVDFLNGTLSEQEAAGVRRRLEDDLELQAAFILIQAAREVEKQTADQFAPTSFGWSRLKTSIAKETSARKWYLTSVPGWQAAAASIFVGLAGWQLASLQNRQDIVREPAGYTPAGGGADGVAALKIAFLPNVPHSSVNLALRSVGGQIAEGPSALGFYTVEFESIEARDKAWSAFQDEDAVVAEVYVD